MQIEPWQIALIVALLLALAIMVSLRRMHNDATSTFDLRDLLMENNRVSKAAAVMLGSFAATTWFFVYYALTGRMTEGYFALYTAAWIAPVVARLIKSNGSAQQPEAPKLTVTATATTVEPQK